MNALLPRQDWDAVVAHSGGTPITLARMMGEVAALAARLPAQGHALNLCGDRYHFAVGLLACLSRGVVSLLPNALAPGLVAQLQATHAGLFCLSDGGPSSFDLPVISLGGQQAAEVRSMPDVDPLQPAVKVFTSGSTGVPQAHVKTWGKLLANGLAEATALSRFCPEGCEVLGTVPAQHMYGFESTVLMPLCSGGVINGGRPFFPADIAAALTACSRPRMLVTTPFHLRTLLDAGIALPPVDLVLSATAPLSGELARRAETAFCAPLAEIYGATETGQLASRRPTAGPTWQALPGVLLRETAGRILAEGGHIEAAMPLNDIVHLHDARHFDLVGRTSDVINIAGKRTSLNYLNQLLNTVPGVVDGAFFLPEDEPADGVVRLTAFVVAPGLAEGEVLRALRPHLDAVFLPRPVIFVERLPRNETGKLPQAALAQLREAALRQAEPS